MAAEVMTYSSLLADIQVYVDRDDQPFLNQRARFVMLAENRIATEIENLGLQRVVTSQMQAGQPIIEKPARWRQSISFNYGAGESSNVRTTLYERTYEWCRNFWPDPSTTTAPRYYCDYDFNHFLVAGTPDSAYPFELVYYERPEPLSTDNQTNWITQHAPQLLLFAALLEAAPFLKNDERIPVWQAAYDRAGQAFSRQDNGRVVDRSSQRK